MSARWVEPYEYSVKKKEEILAILRPHLLEEYKNQEEGVIHRIQNIVWMLRSQESDGREKIFSIRKLKQLESAYNKYEKLLQEIDEDSLEDIEMVLLSDKNARMEARNFGYGEVPSITKILDDCLKRNDLLLRLLSLRERINKKHRPQDTNMRRVIFYLYATYRDFTGKGVAVGGTLQKFMETAISPFYNYEKKLTGYIRELKETPGL